jgi:hypothetical protein
MGEAIASTVSPSASTWLTTSSLEPGSKKTAWSRTGGSSTTTSSSAQR